MYSKHPKYLSWLLCAASVPSISEPNIYFLFNKFKENQVFFYGPTFIIANLVKLFHHHTNLSPQKIKIEM